MQNQNDTTGADSLVLSQLQAVEQPNTISNKHHSHEDWMKALEILQAPFTEARRAPQLLNHDRMTQQKKFPSLSQVLHTVLKVKITTNGL